MGANERPVLITGADGMLGLSLVREYGETGATLLTPGLDEFDILDRERTIEYIRSRAPRLVIHAAAYTAVDKAEEEPDLAMAVNGTGTRTVAEGAREAGACLVAVSTDYVFDGRKGAAYAEEDAPNPISVYGRTKLAGERAVAETLENFLIVRTSWLFGPGRPNFVSGMARRAAAGERVAVVDDQWGSPTYAPHLARALRSLHDRRARGIVHVANEGICTWFELTRETYRLAGGDPSLVRTTSTAALGRPAPRPPFSGFSLDRFARLTGDQMPHWRDALAEYLGTSRPGAR